MTLVGYDQGDSHHDEVHMKPLVKIFKHSTILVCCTVHIWRSPTGLVDSVGMESREMLSFKGHRNLFLWRWSATCPDLACLNGPPLLHSSTWKANKFHDTFIVSYNHLHRYKETDTSLWHVASGKMHILLICTHQDFVTFHTTPHWAVLYMRHGTGSVKCKLH